VQLFERVVHTHVTGRKEKEREGEKIAGRGVWSKKNKCTRKERNEEIFFRCGRKAAAKFDAGLRLSPLHTHPVGRLGPRDPILDKAYRILLTPLLGCHHPTGGETKTILAFALDYEIAVRLSEAQTRDIA
jgi:hypothetical protein